MKAEKIATHHITTQLEEVIRSQVLHGNKLK